MVLASEPSANALIQGRSGIVAAPVYPGVTTASSILSNSSEAAARLPAPGRDLRDQG